MNPRTHRDIFARAHRLCAVPLVVAACSAGCASTHSASGSDLGGDSSDHPSALDDADTVIDEVVRPIDAGWGDASAMDADGLPDSDLDATRWSDALEMELSSSDASNDVPRPLGRRVLKIESSSGSDCALVDDGSVWCWGEPSPEIQRIFMGRDGGIVYHTEPIRMNTPEAVSDLVGVGAGYCVLDARQQAWCWGYGTEISTFENPATPNLDPRPVEGAQGERLTYGTRGDGFACVWRGTTPRCWGRRLPAYTFGVEPDGGFSGAYLASGPTTLEPAVALGISRTSFISGVGFDGERTVRRWGEWRDHNAALARSWTLPIVPIQIAMNSPRGGGCAIDAEGAIACWGRLGQGDPSSVLRLVRQPMGLPLAAGIASRHPTSGYPSDQINLTRVLGRDGSIWELELPPMSSSVAGYGARQIEGPAMLPSGVRDFKRSGTVGFDGMVLGDDGVVYRRRSNLWEPYFP